MKLPTIRQFLPNGWELHVCHFALRACIVNHRTTEPDVRDIVSEVLAAAAEIDR